MRERMEKIGAFLGSATLTIWLVGLFIVYYLTMAVWIGEAFSRYTTHISSSLAGRAFYVLFLANVTARVVGGVRRMHGRGLVLLLRLPLLIGLVLVLASFFLSLNVREKNLSRPLGEGDPLELPWMREPYWIVKVEPAISKRALRTDDSAIFDYEPGATIIDEEGTRREFGAFPPRKVGETFLHVLLFGIGPGVELRRGGEVVSRGYVALRIVPFGRVDKFTIPPHPYEFYLSVVPSSVVQKGRETARTYDLEHPRYRIEIVKGDRVLAKEETEDKVLFDGNMTLSFFTPSDWIMIESTRDPFLPWFAFSLLLLASGALLFPLSYLVRPT